jgi:radical SAM superfamily enzyme YgiQ (UPF0313 family)
MRLCLVLPPLTQLNTPYPSIGYLARFLRSRGWACDLRDCGLELVCRLFSKKGLTEIFDVLDTLEEMPEPAWRALALREHHLRVINPLMAFVQGKDRTLARRILKGSFLPTGPRLALANTEAFGEFSIEDAARYLATLHLEDLADLVTACIDDGFGLISYQKHLASGPVYFDPIEARLARHTLVDRHIDALADSIDAQVIGISIPFPGNLYAALRMGRRLKKRGLRVVAGGGYVNTELRDVCEDRIWQSFDALSYDDGEGPLLALLEKWAGGKDTRHRLRTADKMYHAKVERPPMTVGADFEGLPLNDYLDLTDTLNPAHRLWADGRWNKITLAHGCYWKKCSFCDTRLDYIEHYEQAHIGRLVDTIEEICTKTGVQGFHFVDEAAPPASMKALSLELLRRDTAITWWGNIRFEKSFTPDLCRLFSHAGLVAVTGGLEVASNRLLDLMQKGVSVEQVVRAANAFQEAGILVHAYLMYGFPTQSVQETIDSMELVRQMFAEGLLNSAFWHRFVLTRHSPVFSDPKHYSLKVLPNPQGTFTQNDLGHTDVKGGNHDLFDSILPQALDAWMHGHDLDRPVHTWFDKTMPPTGEAPDRIQKARQPGSSTANRLVWIGGDILHTADGVMLHGTDSTLKLSIRPDVMQWLIEVIEQAHPRSEGVHLPEVRKSFPGDWVSWQATWTDIRRAGLLLI